MRTMIAVNDGGAPLWRSIAGPTRRRSSTASAMSTCMFSVKCGALRTLAAMRSPITRRRAVSGTRVTSAGGGSWGGGGVGSGGRLLLHKRQHILPADPPAGAAALDLGEIQPALAAELARQRG